MVNIHASDRGIIIHALRKVKECYLFYSVRFVRFALPRVNKKA